MRNYETPRFLQVVANSLWYRLSALAEILVILPGPAAQADIVRAFGAEKIVFRAEGLLHTSLGRRPRKRDSIGLEG